MTVPAVRTLGRLAEASAGVSERIPFVLYGGSAVTMLVGTDRWRRYDYDIDLLVDVPGSQLRREVSRLNVGANSSLTFDHDRLPGEPDDDWMPVISVWHDPYNGRLVEFFPTRPETPNTHDLTVVKEWAFRTAMDVEIEAEYNQQFGSAPVYAGTTRDDLRATASARVVNPAASLLTKLLAVAPDSRKVPQAIADVAALLSIKADQELQRALGSADSELMETVGRVLQRATEFAQANTDYIVGSQPSDDPTQFDSAPAAMAAIEQISAMGEAFGIDALRRSAICTTKADMQPRSGQRQRFRISREPPLDDELPSATNEITDASQQDGASGHQMRARQRAAASDTIPAAMSAPSDGNDRDLRAPKEQKPTDLPATPRAPDSPEAQTGFGRITFGSR